MIVGSQRAPGARKVGLAVIVATFVATGCAGSSHKAAAGAASPDRANPAASASSVSPSAVVPSPSPSPTPIADILAGLAVKQSDVPGGFSVATIPDGDLVEGQVTLDLCDGSFPSEALRVARHQVGVSDAAGDAVMSTEVVAYRDAGAAAQTLEEVQAAKTNCPTTYMPSGDGSTSIRFRFAASPTIPAVAGVDARTFDATARLSTGATERDEYAYLVRGRLLIAVYLTVDTSSAKLTVGGAAGLAGIAGQFENRLSALPADAVADQA